VQPPSRSEERCPLDLPGFKNLEGLYIGLLSAYHRDWDCSQMLVYDDERRQWKLLLPESLATRYRFGVDRSGGAGDALPTESPLRACRPDIVGQQSISAGV